MAELIAGDGMEIGKYSRYRILILGALTGISVMLEIVVHGILGIEVVYTHFFYLPIALGAIWYGLRGIAVAAGLAAVYLISTYMISGSIGSADLIRSGMFLVVGIVIAVIAEIFSRHERRLVNEVADACIKARPGPGTTVLDNLDEMRNRILSYANVSHLREEKNVQGLIKALRHPDVTVQYEAVEALGDLGDPAAVTPLVEVLSRDEYSAVRWKAAEALSKIGTPAVGELIGALSNPDEDVRWKAAIALGDIGDARAIDPLIGLLGDPDRFVKSRVAYALGKIGQPAVHPLTGALNNGDPGVKWGAAIALGMIKDPAALPVLVKALSDRSESVRDEAAAALSGMGSQVVPVLVDCMEKSGGERLERMVTSIWDPAGQEESMLFRLLLEAPPGIRERAAVAVERRGGPRISRFATRLREGLPPVNRDARENELDTQGG